MSEEAPAKLAGSYELLQLNIRSLTSGGAESIRRIAHRFTINESVDRTFLTGTVTITDGTNIMHRLPITGNELLVIETRDYYGAVLKECYKIYAVSDYKYVSEQDESLVQYTLHFCSREKFIADTTDIKRAFRGLISEQVFEIYDQYIGTFNESELSGTNINVPFKGITIQETENEHVYTIPNMKPDQAMNFLARRAYHSGTPAGVFKFWETRKGFHFLSLQGSEQAYRFRYQNEIPDFVYSTNFQNLPYLQDEKMRQVTSLGLNKGFNTADAFRRGAYTSRVLELDILNRTPIETRYNHIDEVENNQSSTFKAGNDQLYTKQNLRSVNSYFTEGPEFLVIKDYPSVGTDTGTLSTEEVNRAIRTRQEYAENTVKSIAYGYQLEQNKIELTVHGSYAVFAGAYIFLVVPPTQTEARSGTTEDVFASGYYLVHSCTHEYDGNTYMCKIIATRPGDRTRPDVRGDVTDVNVERYTAQLQEATEALSTIEAVDAAVNGAVIQLGEFRNEVLNGLNRAIDNDTTTGGGGR